MIATEPKRMSESELKALIDQEAYQALGYVGKLTEQRRRALEYYQVKAVGDLSPPEVEGRSYVVSPDVAEVVEGAMPSLMRIFCSGDEVVRFEARKQEDEGKAALATEYINWLLWTQNEGWKIVYWWIKDALLSKNGIVKVYWDETKEITQEDYKGLTENQMANLAGDDEVKVLEHNEVPDEVDDKHREEAQTQLAQMQAQFKQQPNPQLQQQIAQITQALAQPAEMLHDITIRRTKKRQKICVANVPPEEFLISRNAKSIDDTPFVAHRVQKTLSSLLAEGYDKDQVMRLSDDNNWAQYAAEAIERRINDDEMTTPGWDQSGSDPMMRKVWLMDCYIQADVDGDGYAEWRHVLKAGFEILVNEMCDGPVFADMTPVPMPHRFFGLSLADQTMDWQRVKTALLRQLLDALYLGNNPRFEAVEGQVNFDDLLTSRPGGVVRVKQVGQIGQLQTQDVSQSAINGIEFFDQIIRGRTGVEAQNAGPDADAINNMTATKANIVQNASTMKLELVARCFAELGFKRLFRLMLKTAIRYQNKPAMVKLSGDWQEIDPQEWRDGFDLSISVGLGTGNRDQQEAQLNRLLGVQMQLLPLGVTTPANVYESAKKLPNILGYKNDEQFFTDPQKNPQPQHPNPEMIKAQAQMQIEQGKGQVQMQVAQMEAQAKQETDLREQQFQQAQAQAQMQLEAQLKEREAAMTDARERDKMAHEAQLEQMKAMHEASEKEKDRANAVLLAQIAAQTATNNAALQAQTKADEIAAGSQTAAMQVHAQSQQAAQKAEPKPDKPDPRVDEVLKQVKGLQEHVAKTSSNRVVSIKRIKGPDGRMTGAERAYADGTVEHIPIQ